MHTTQNAEKYAYGKLSKTAQDGLQSLKLVFGSRNCSGFHRVSLKRKLNDALGVQNRSIMLTDLGSRFAVHSTNARAVILHRTEVSLALNSTNKVSDHSERLKSLLANQWDKFALKVGAFALIFFGIISPFHTVVFHG